MERYKGDYIYVIFLFLLWPFLSVVFALKNYTKPWAKNIVWFFIAFYGYTMVISNEEMDANRMLYNFDFYLNNVYSISDVFEIIKTQPDIIMPFFNFFASRLTDNPRLYLFFLATIFGFFYSRNLWILLNLKKGRFKYLSLSLLILYAFIVPFWEINGFRFWTSTNIFIYGVFNYFILKNKKPIILCYLTVFLHFSFLLPITILTIYFLIGKRVYMFYALYVFTFFFLQVSPKLVNSSVGLLSLPTAIESEISSYSDERYVEKREELKKIGMNWYVNLGPNMAKYLTLVLISIVLFRYKKKLQEEQLISLFSFSLLFSAVALLISSVPSGSRFIAISYLLVYATLFLIIQNKQIIISPIVKKYSYITIMFYVLVMIRIGFDTIGVSTIFGNPLFVSIMSVDVALIELIK